VVIGFTRLEAEAGSQLVFGETTEFPEGDHDDLLLDGLVFGKGNGFASAVREHKRAVFDLNVEVESDTHDPPSHLVVSMLAERVAKMYPEFMHIIKGLAS
jgi:hypothetical protein